MCFGEKTGRSAFIALKGTEVVRLNEIPSTCANSVCIGETVPIDAGGRRICDIGLYVSPAGAITVCTPVNLSDNEASTNEYSSIRQIADIMSQWTHKNLDDIAANHSFLLDGQAAFVIDLMARRGLLNYSHKQSFYDSIDKALSGGNIFFVPSDPSPAPMPRRKFIKTFSDNRGLDPDDFTGFICELEAIDGVTAIVRGSQLVVSYYDSEDFSGIPLIYFKASSNRSDVFVLPLTVRRHLEKNGFLASLATNLLTFFIRFADRDLLRPSPENGQISMLYLDPVTLFAGAADLATEIKRFSRSLSST